MLPTDDDYYVGWSPTYITEAEFQDMARHGDGENDHVKNFKPSNSKVWFTYEYAKAWEYVTRLCNKNRTW